MAEPKKRTNKSKRNMRRMHDKVANPCFLYCPSCHEAMRPHHICSKCGEYRGKKIIGKEDIAKIKIANDKPKE